MEQIFEEVLSMTEDELFAKAWLFLYQAAGKNIGFDVQLAEQSTSEENSKAQDRPA